MFRELSLLALMSILAAQLSAADLTVTLLNSKKKPLNQVAGCKLTNTATKDELPTSTDKEGKVTFENLRAGTYFFYTSIAGFVPFRSKLIEMVSKDIELNFVLAEEKQFTQFEQAGTVAFEQQNYSTANEQYGKAYQLAPWHPDLCANYVRSLVRAGEKKKADEIVKATGGYDPDAQKLVHASMRFEEGRMALEAQDFKAAEAALTEAVQGDPENADAYYGLALALGHQQRYVEAVKPISLAVMLRPNDEDFKKVKQTIEYNARMTGK